MNVEIGLRVRYAGDQANMSGIGEVTEMCRKYCTIDFDDGRIFKLVPKSIISENPGDVIHTLDSWLKLRADTLKYYQQAAASRKDKFARD